MAIRVGAVFEFACLSITVFLVVGQELFVHDFRLNGRICQADTQTRLQNVSTKITCGAHCSKNTSCRSFFYNNGTGVCQLNQGVFHHKIPGNECKLSDENTSYFFHINEEHCAAGYTWYSAGGYCFKFNSTCMTWHAARDQCHAEGAELLMPKTVEEMDYFVGVLKDEYASEVIYCGPSEYVWVGATDEYQEGTWKWSDETTANLAGLWAPNEPNNIGNQDCLAIDGRHDWKYDDRSCSITSEFVCAMQS